MENNVPAIYFYILKNLGIGFMCPKITQHKVGGLLQNFSKTEYSCRKCMCGRRNLCTAETYEDIHSKNFEPRTNQTLFENWQEKEQIRSTHVNSVKNLSMYHQFPFFNIPEQLPQCSR